MLKQIQGVSKEYDVLQAGLSRKEESTVKGRWQAGARRLHYYLTFFPPRSSNIFLSSPLHLLTQPHEKFIKHD